MLQIVKLELSCAISESKKKKYNFLFQRKHIVIKEFVQFLICIVDAKLLERVDGKIFKTENVQNAQESKNREREKINPNSSR